MENTLTPHPQRPLLKKHHNALLPKRIACEQSVMPWEGTPMVSCQYWGG